MKQWQFLQKSAELGKLAHAYIFSGNDKEGQEKTALYLILFLNCEQKASNGTPCQKCQSCRNIKARIHGDVTYVNPMSSSDRTERQEIKISQIRNLYSHLHLGAWSSPYKCVVMHEAHEMNTEAQSAFLKLLEEPKGNTLFLLLTSYPAMLLDTIRSRTQEITFYNFSKKQISKDIEEELQKLQTSTIQERFAYAKNLADSPERISQTLLAWLEHTRYRLIAALKNSEETEKLIFFIQAIQEIQPMLQNTNANARLALERIMLEL